MIKIRFTVISPGDDCLAFCLTPVLGYWNYKDNGDYRFKHAIKIAWLFWQISILWKLNKNYEMHY